jgi:hypothetical protein
VPADSYVKMKKCLFLSTDIIMHKCCRYKEKKGKFWGNWGIASPRDGRFGVGMEDY